MASRFILRLCLFQDETPEQKAKRRAIEKEHERKFKESEERFKTMQKGHPPYEPEEDRLRREKAERKAREAEEAARKAAEEASVKADLEAKLAARFHSK
jgi:hypothetical protein